MKASIRPAKRFLVQRMMIHNVKNNKRLLSVHHHHHHQAPKFDELGGGNNIFQINYWTQTNSSRAFSSAIPKVEEKFTTATATTTTTRVDDEPLPRTLEDALRHTSRAVVITEKTMPFEVFDVNDAWENLCGYTYVESKGKSLGSLLQGPATDLAAVTALIHQLLKGEDATTVVTNYKKNGEKFLNRLHVGPLFDEDGNITHYVGVLQEVG